MSDWYTRLNDALEEKGWTQAELARRSGVPVESIRKYVQGKVEKPRGNILEKLADALGKTVTWLRDGVSDTSQLTADELQLIEIYRTLSPQGREMATALVRTVSSTATKTKAG